jgi:Transcription factor WhiB
MIGFVHLPGAGRLVVLDGRTRLTHRRPTCLRLARYRGRDVVEVTVRGSNAVVGGGWSFPVRWCPQCGLVAQVASWRAKAACVNSTVDFFAFNPAEQANAAAICRRCPVQVECGEYGEEVGAVAGVWGGSVRAA